MFEESDMEIVKSTARRAIRPFQAADLPPEEIRQRAEVIFEPLRDTNLMAVAMAEVEAAIWDTDEEFSPLYIQAARFMCGVDPCPPTLAGHWRETAGIHLNDPWTTAFPVLGDNQ